MQLPSGPSHYSLDTVVDVAALNSNRTTSLDADRADGFAVDGSNRLFVPAYNVDVRVLKTENDRGTFDYSVYVTLNVSILEPLTNPATRRVVSDTFVAATL